MGITLRRNKIFQVGVVESAGGVIHGTGKHPGEGKCGVVDRSHTGRPLGVLLAHHSFAGHQIRIGAAQPIGLEGSVVIDHEMMLGGLLHHAAIPVHHPLVVAVHEVDLDPGDAPFFKQRKRLVHVFVDRGPMRPQPDADILLLGVAQQFGKIDCGVEVGDVCRIGIIARLGSRVERPSRHRSACRESPNPRRTQCSASWSRCSCRG